MQRNDLKHITGFYQSADLAESIPAMKEHAEQEHQALENASEMLARHGHDIDRMIAKQRGLQPEQERVQEQGRNLEEDNEQQLGRDMPEIPGR